MPHQQQRSRPPCPPTFKTSDLDNIHNTNLLPQRKNETFNEHFEFNGDGHRADFYWLWAGYWLRFSEDAVRRLREQERRTVETIQSLSASSQTPPTAAPTTSSPSLPTHYSNDKATIPEHETLQSLSKRLQDLEETVSSNLHLATPGEPAATTTPERSSSPPPVAAALSTGDTLDKLLDTPELLEPPPQQPPSVEKPQQKQYTCFFCSVTSRAATLQHRHMRKHHQW
ncbi:hypothetical protein B0T21DRAFT_407190 [Apiosordaria backusii]|uniref:Uncharacterized protein n=1 Tax=Apiosordaria backusii TaxID=314023 RepID=A0AA40F0H3_9PEZI|nr:hypothetical protein B0T21DRAFT_407190 [Apiosordaria backusii]